MDAGELVSDDIVLGMIKERLEDSDASSGYILDGFPRNVAQAKGLAGVLRDLGKYLDAAVLMDVDFEVLMKRLTGRRTCSKTGKLLNIYFSPQEELDACFDAGGELLQRDDDNEDTIRNRLDVYERETQPLIGYYREREVLQVVNADGRVEDVYARLRDTLGALRTSGPS
jgi:adenylate kinase